MVNIVCYIRDNQMATRIFIDLLSIYDLASHISSIKNGKMKIQSEL